MPYHYDVIFRYLTVISECKSGISLIIMSYYGIIMTCPCSLIPYVVIILTKSGLSPRYLEEAPSTVQDRVRDNFCFVTS